MRILNYLMNFNFLHGFSAMTIYNMEMLEKIKAFQSFVRDSDKNLKSLNVLVCRILFVAIVIFLSIFIRDLRLVYAINGVFLNSFIGLIFPGIMGIIRDKKLRDKDSAFNSWSDKACIVAGLFSIVMNFMPERQ